ncbi:hypothetical protein YC2023_043758 [Brassica napus]
MELTVFLVIMLIVCYYCGRNDHMGLPLEPIHQTPQHDIETGQQLPLPKVILFKDIKVEEEGGGGCATSQHTQAWQIGRLGPIRTEKRMPRNALELLDMEGFKREENSKCSVSFEVIVTREKEKENKLNEYFRIDHMLNNRSIRKKMVDLIGQKNLDK